MAGPADAPLSGAGQNFAFHPLPRFRLFQILSLAGILRRTKPRILHAHHGDDYWTALLASRLVEPRPLVIFSRHLAKSPRSHLSKKISLCASGRGHRRFLLCRRSSPSRP